MEKGNEKEKIITFDWWMFFGFITAIICLFGAIGLSRYQVKLKNQEIKKLEKQVEHWKEVSKEYETILNETAHEIYVLLKNNELQTIKIITPNPNLKKKEE